MFFVFCFTNYCRRIFKFVLSDKFEGKFVHKALRSLDLNPCDFFLWDNLKWKAYNPLPKSLDELKANIDREIKKISTDILKSIFWDLRKRCKLHNDLYTKLFVFSYSLKSYSAHQKYFRYPNYSYKRHEKAYKNLLIISLND